MFVDNNIRTVAKATLFVGALFMAHTLFSYIFIRTTSLRNIQKQLTGLTKRIQADITYQDGKWDISRYNADIMTPYPNGSSGFTKSLYIITSDGFIIERTNPVEGLLNTSDFKHLTQFQVPQTIKTISGEEWRVYSQKIRRGEKDIAVVLIAKYITEQDYAKTTDEKLKENANYIINTINFNKDDSFDLSKLDIRNIHYEFSFEIVDTFNNVMINNGRVPTFIDPSYIKQYTEGPKQFEYVNPASLEKFYFVSNVIKDGRTPIGIIVIGESIHSFETLLSSFILFSVLVSGLLLLPLTLYIFAKYIKKIGFSSPFQSSIDISQVSKIYFDKEKSELVINNNAISIPYATNQYSLCEAIFKNPKKFWETDELLEKMGENIEEKSTRKIYDAMLAINKRVGFKLIEYKDKIYKMNQQLLNVIHK